MKILIISFSKLESDPRVYRQIEHLCGRHEVYTAGLSASGLPVTSHYTLTVKTVSSFKDKVVRALQYKLLSGERMYWHYHKDNDLSFIRSEGIDIIIANDFQAMPLAVRFRGSTKIILDAHEFTPRQLEHKWNWRFFEQPYQKYIVARYIQEADAFITVSSGIAAEYEREYGVAAELITNAGSFQDLQIKKCGLPIHLVYHGYATRGRSLETLIDAVRSTTLDCRLHLMLVGSARFIRDLKKFAAGNNKIIFEKTVALKDIVETIHNYDVGLAFYPPNNFNLKHSLPNKFFEFIQARLAVVIGPTPPMAELVGTYGLGKITKDFTKESLVAVLNTLTPENINDWKRNSHSAANNLNKENNMKTLDSIVSALHAES